MSDVKIYDVKPEIAAQAHINAETSAGHHRIACICQLPSQVTGQLVIGMIFFESCRTENRDALLVECKAFEAVSFNPTISQINMFRPEALRRRHARKKTNGSFFG